MTEKDLPEQPGQPKMSKSWFKDSSVEWDGLQLLQWSDASLQARHTAGENSQYFTWHDQKIGFLWKPEVFPAIFVALFPAKCIVSFQPLAPPKTRKPIWARKLAPPKTRFCIQFNQFTPTPKRCTCDNSVQRMNQVYYGWVPFISCNVFSWY